MTDAQLVNPLRVSESSDGKTRATLRCVLGPRDDWFGNNVSAFLDTEWTVTSDSNRVGLRLDGEEPIERVKDGELPPRAWSPAPSKSHPMASPWSSSAIMP